MSLDGLLPLLVVASSLVPGLVIFALPEERTRLRSALNLAGAFSKLFFVAWMLVGVYRGGQYEARLPLLPNIELVLRADSLSLLFVTLSTVLWLLTTLYAIGYLEGSPHRSRFFGFFSLCVTATVGVALSGNLLTFLLFYEMLTLTTWPLVVHRGTDTARRAGQSYLAYTLSGGALLLLGTVWLYSLAGNLDFTERGVLHVLDETHGPALRVIFVLLIAGLGVKAALVPLHGWLPRAMVAPAPVSALLHAVAVVKAGAFGIARVVYDVYGVEFSQSLGLLLPLALIASITIIWGSLRALMQDDLKKRLAFSTVSQVSYIVLGVSLFGPVGTIGGLVHLVHQGIMKITLFFCAGNYAETLGIHRVSEMNGAGRRMPFTSIAFSIAALGMIGAPLTAGAVSKHWLMDGAVSASMTWVTWVLWTSSLLNALYFLPILWRAWVRRPPDAWPDEQPRARFGAETAWLLLVPPLLTGALTLLIGVFPDLDVAPLAWVQLIARREYADYAP